MTEKTKAQLEQELTAALEEIESLKNKISGYKGQISKLKNAGATGSKVIEHK